MVKNGKEQENPELLYDSNLKKEKDLVCYDAMRRSGPVTLRNEGLQDK
jgi:hypothetical protein